jgi:hypothetical protein
MPELLLPRLKREIEARLAELRPAIEEVEQLEAAREALLAEREALQARRRLPPHRRPARYDGREPEPVTRRAPPRPALERSAPTRSAPTRSAPQRPALERPAPQRPALERPAPARPAPQRPAPAPKPSVPAGGDPLRDAIVAIVEERPGVSLAEIISVTKLPKGDVARAVGALKREGVLADEAGGVKLASRKPLTLAEIAAAATRDQGVSDAEWEAARPRSKRARARS